MSGPPAAGAPGRASLGVRLGYVAVFLVFGSLGIALAWSEWTQAFRILEAPYHFGDPPSPLALGASAAGAVCAAWILLRFARNGRASLPLAGAVLAGAVASWIWVMVAEPKGRTWGAADKQIVDAASALRERMAARLQAEKHVPTDPAAWQAALETAVKTPSPARARWGATRWSVQLLSRPDEVPAPLVPGTFLVWISPDASEFDLSPVGFDKEGGVARLWDASGQPLVLRNVYEQNGAP